MAPPDGLDPEYWFQFGETSLGRRVWAFHQDVVTFTADGAPFHRRLVDS
jgi:hypothetical protein